MAKKEVDFGFMPRGADAAAADLARQPFPGAVLVYRFPLFGVHVFDPEALPPQTKECLPGHSLKQLLGDTGAGKTEPEFFAALTKRWNTLAAGAWSARGTGEGAEPRMTEKAAAIQVYAEELNIDLATATDIYDGKQADRKGVTWNAARRKAWIGKHAARIAELRGRKGGDEDF